MMMNQLENKVALITGGASRPGLGSAIADKFAAEGAFVFLTDIDESGCELFDYKFHLVELVLLISHLLYFGL